MCVLDLQESFTDVLKAYGGMLKTCSRKPDGTLFLWFGRVIKAVADAWNSQDELRPLGGRFDFLAQLCDVHMQAVRSSVGLFSPDLFQEHLAGEKLAPVNNKHLEQVEFGGGQGNFLLAELDLPPREIDRKRAALKARLCSAGWLDGPAQGNAHTSQHLFDAERFRDIVVRTQVERLDLVAFGVLDRKHDNRNIGFGSHAAAYFQFVDARQQEIEQNEVWP